MTEDDFYRLAIHVADDSKSTIASDKVMEPIQISQYTKNTDIPGLSAVPLFLFTDFPTVFAEGAGFSEYHGVNGDPVNAEAHLDIELSLGARLESLEINWIAFNAITEDSFIIKRNVVDTTLN